MAITKKVIGILFVMLLFLLPCAAVEKEAEDISLEGLSFIELDFDTQDSIWTGRNLRELDLPQSFSESIVSFDVSSSGEILLALKSHKILIFNKNYELTNAYAFSIPGDYYVFWNGEYISLYGVRSDDISFFSKDLSYYRVTKLDNKNISFSEFTDFLRFKTDETVAGVSYSLVKPEGFMGDLAGYEYDQLICKNGTGKITTIYTTGKAYSSSAMWTLILLSLMLIGAAFMVTVTVILPLIRRKRI